MNKLLNKNTSSYLWFRSGVFYFIRRVPGDVRRHYKADRVCLSLRTKSMRIAARSAASINQRLEDYWLGLRHQHIAIPAINLVRTPEALDAPDCLTLSEARDLYLRLKSAAKDKTFVRSAHRNVGYVVKVLGDHPLSVYSTVDAAKFRDWLIEQGMARDTIKGSLAVLGRSSTSLSKSKAYAAKMHSLVPSCLMDCVSPNDSPYR